LNGSGLIASAIDRGAGGSTLPKKLLDLRVKARPPASATRASVSRPSPNCLPDDFAIDGQTRIGV
jgi:hypothetical protein